MKHRTTQWLTLAAASIAMACSTNQPPVTTVSRTTTTTTTAAGDVALNDPSGMWVDTAGGAWMDTTGTMWMGRRVVIIDLLPVDIAAMTNANVVAHLATGDSLEIAISQLGVSRAQNTAVRDFAQRMVNEHSAHRQATIQAATQNGIAPIMAVPDTADAMIAARMMNRLSSTPAGPTFDRRLMRAEVMMHEHMLRELNAIRPQATGAALQLVDQTIPVVRQHLSDAQSIWRQVGGGMNNTRSGDGTNP